ISSLSLIPSPSASSLFPYTTLFRSLHCRAHAQLLAIGHATFEPAGAVAQAVHAIIGAHHFIMSFGAWTTSFFKAIANFYALDRLDAHQRSSQLGIEAVIAGDM